ncbi:MAG: tetratricopeptide repeat protein, partial [Candidatus Adiutrix sp.]|nr:tetratricopeptide repeat protein [Candidatus Adiutrix sp.]
MIASIKIKCPLRAFITVMFLAATFGCSHISWGDGGPEALSYYYFIKSNYQEVSHEDGEAVKNMAKAAKAARGSYYLELETARLYSRVGEAGKAMEHAQAAIALAPGAAEARLFAAWLAANAGDWGEAEKQYGEVLRLDETNHEALVYLGAVYSETGRRQEAEAAFKKLVRLDPSYLSYYYLGRFYLNLERRKEAIAAFEVSAAKNPDFAASLTELAVLYEQEGNARAAEKTYRAMIKSRPDGSMPKARLARLLLKNGRKAEAEKLLREVGGRAQDSSQAQLQIALIYMDQNLYKEAVAEFEAILAADPLSDQARYLLAAAYLESGGALPGHVTKARENLMKINPESEFYIDARLLLASTASGASQVRLEESLAIISSAVKLRPDSSRLTAAQAMILEELGDLNQAKRVLVEGVKTFPHDAELRFRLGVVEDKLGNKAGCISAMRAAVELNPRHADALNYLAYTWAERGENLKEALVMAEKANAIKPDDGAIIDTLGWIRYMMGEDDKALE